MVTVVPNLMRVRRMTGVGMMGHTFLQVARRFFTRRMTMFQRDDAAKVAQVSFTGTAVSVIGILSYGTSGAAYVFHLFRSSSFIR